MKDMRVEVKITTYPLLSDELPESTMFSVMRTSPLNFLPHVPQLPASHITSLYTAGYHSVALDDEGSSATHIPSNYSTLPPQNPMGFAQQTLSKSIYTVCDNSEEEEEEEDFQTVTLDDHHWFTDLILDRHMCIHKHLQPHYLCSYSSIYRLNFSIIPRHIGS